MGDWAHLILQIGITIAVIGALAALVYWFVRRYSGLGLGGIGRGRVPRLAVVDALTIDRRRRLLLVRRDNVEHLIMVGGPADVVVEPAIQRTRQRQPQRPSAMATGAETTAPSDLPLVPQSPPPVQMRPPEPTMEAPPMASGGDNVERLAFPVSRPPSAPVYRVDRRQTAPIDTRQLLEAIGEAKGAGLSGAPQEPTPSTSHYPPGLSNGRDLRLAASESQRILEPTPDGESDAALTKISDLEQEMARLLGELTVKRPS